MPTNPPTISSFGHDRTALHRPAVSSPLTSSSPIRATSPPLSPRDPNVLPRRQVQSSPIQCPPTKLFKYATREARPNPLVRKREDAQESRRKLFLQNVRQRADDKRWERRGGENELLKLEWLRLNRELRQAKDADLDGVILDGELGYEEELRREQSRDFSAEPDEMMVDALEQQAEAEIDALVSSLPPEIDSLQIRPDSPHFLDDDDYDSLFSDIMAQQSIGDNDTPVLSQDVEMS